MPEGPGDLNHDERRLRIALECLLFKSQSLPDVAKHLDQTSISLDILRAAALGGVLLVNLLTIFRVPLSAHILGSDEPLGPGGAFLLRLLRWLVEFKAFTLFSFLFGVGVAIQAGRTESHGSAAFLLRRFGALLAIGLIHLILVWNGDILALYGLCGLLLIPLLRLPPSGMAILGLSLIAAPYVIRLPVPFPDTTTLRELTAGAIHNYRLGGWQDIIAFRWRETRLLILPLLLPFLPRTLGLMLWGGSSVAKRPSQGQSAFLASCRRYRRGGWHHGTRSPE